MTAPRPRVEAALLRAVARTWRQLNQLHFGDGMRPPAFVLTDDAGTLGTWRPRDRTIGLSRQLLAGQSWTVVVEVLKHEMVHQYVHEVLKATDEAAHGRGFQRICARIGLDPAASGLPVVAPADPARDRALRKVQRLLALAESDNVHEAEAAMAAAHRLMRKHNIDWAEESADRTWTFRQVGEIRRRTPAHEKVLAGLLARHFFVEAIWVHAVDTATGDEGRVLELCGAVENVEMGAWVHAFLLRTADRLWRVHQAAEDLPGRLGGRYRTGVMMGFGDKLDAQAQACEEAGLVYVGDAGLDDWVGRRHPRLHTARRTRVVADRTFADGHAAGRDIVLHKPVSQDTSSSRGRRLVDRSPSTG